MADPKDALAREYQQQVRVLQQQIELQRTLNAQVPPAYLALQLPSEPEKCIFEKCIFERCIFEKCIFENAFL